VFFQGLVSALVVPEQALFSPPHPIPLPFGDCVIISKKGERGRVRGNGNKIKWKT
jgi:hypothetical protein